MAFLLLLVSVVCVVNGSDFVGYYAAEDGGGEFSSLQMVATQAQQFGPGLTSPAEAVMAKCSYEADKSSQRWSTTGSMGVCVETNDESTMGTRTTNFYVGTACAGQSARGNYLAIADDRSATVTVNFGCYRSCATITIFDASPSVSPSALFIGCPDQLGLPPEARTVYRTLPSGATLAPVSTQRSAAPGTSAPTKTESDMTSGSPAVTEPPKSSVSGDESSDSTSKSASSKTPVIVGAVVGSIGGVSLIALAFFLGRRFTAKKQSPHVADRQTDEYQGKPELGGTETTSAAAASPESWGGWGQQYQQQPYQQQQFQPPTELASNYPAAQQLPTESGPHEFPGSSGYYQYQGQTGQEGSAFQQGQGR